VPGFRPSVHGLGFPNRFAPGPTFVLGPFDSRILGMGDASTGLCGGMSLTARDLWAAGLPAPATTSVPENGSRRFRSLVRRQVQSLDWMRVPLRYFDLQAFRPDPPTRLARLLRREPARVPALLVEWPRIRTELESGVPCVVGLIRTSGGSPWRLTQNHQVLAFGWDEEPGSITIRIYDPNHPRRYDVSLHVTVDAGDGPWHGRIRMTQSTGETLLGFFRQPYPRPDSVAAWR
jgi:hypothetical protein